MAEETNETTQQILCCAPSAVLGMIKCKGSTRKPRHIELKAFFLQRWNARPEVSPVQVRTSETLADGFTQIQSTPNSVHLSRLGLQVTSSPGRKDRASVVTSVVVIRRNRSAFYCSAPWVCVLSLVLRATRSLSAYGHGCTVGVNRDHTGVSSRENSEPALAVMLHSPAHALCRLPWRQPGRRPIACCCRSRDRRVALAQLASPGLQQPWFHFSFSTSVWCSTTCPGKYSMVSPSNPHPTESRVGNQRGKRS